MFQEAGIDNENGKEPFTELNYILDRLKHKDLDPALEWAEKHRATLEKQVHRYLFLISFSVIKRNFSKLCLHRKYKF